MGTIKIIVTTLILSFSINAIPVHMTDRDWSIVDNKRIQKMIETVEPTFEKEKSFDNDLYSPRSCFDTLRKWS